MPIGREISQYSTVNLSAFVDCQRGGDWKVFETEGYSIENNLPNTLRAFTFIAFIVIIHKPTIILPSANF